VFEAHGNHAEVDIEFARLRHRFDIHFSPSFLEDGSIDCATGGVLVFSLKSHFVGWLADVENLVDGRCCRFNAYRMFDGVLQNYFAFGAHNHLYTAPEVRLVEADLMHCLDEARSDPQNNTVILCGDLNLHSANEPPMSLDLPARTRATNTPLVPNVSNSRPHQRIWENIFSKMFEIKMGKHTHVNIANLTLGKIDRVFCSTPPSGLLNLRNSAGVSADPMDLYVKGISDHSAGFWSICPPPKKPNIQPRIRPQWAKHPVFKKHCKDLLSGLDFQGCSCQEHLESLKLVFREAADKTRNYMLSSQDKSSDSVLVQLSTIARCVWSGDRRVANLAKSSMLLGPVHLAPGNGRPCLLDPIAFEQEFASAKKSHLAKERECVHRFFGIFPET